MIANMTHNRREKQVLHFQLENLLDAQIVRIANGDAYSREKML
jgi:hypothetical protein